MASIYDTTRALPPEPRAAAISQLADALERVQTRTVLEVGIGTGRVALPLAERGFTIVGVDIAAAMLAQLQQKLPGAGSGRIWASLADARQLPFRDRSFRTCLAIHVLHLIEDPDAVLAEIARILAPGGTLLYVGEIFASATAGSRVRQQWRQLMAAEGAAVDQRRSLLPLFARHGWEARAAPLIEWAVSLPVHDSLAQIRQRAFSSSWRAPEPVHQRVCDRLEAWAAATIGLDAVETVPHVWQLYEVRREDSGSPHTRAPGR